MLSLATAIPVAISSLSALAAVTRAEHTVSWYAANAAARARVLRSCQDDQSFDFNGDCINARKGDTLALSRSYGGGGGAFPENSDPETYRKSPIMRAITLKNCQSSSPPPASWCEAAQAAGGGSQ